MTRSDPKGKFNNTDTTVANQAAALGSDLLESHGKVSLREHKSKNFINIDGSGWAVSGPQNDTEYVVVPTTDNRHYIVVANGTYKGYYLSYNNNSYVGAYSGWSDACYWNVSPRIDCTPYPGLYLNKKIYVCCNGRADNPNALLSVEISDTRVY